MIEVPIFATPEEVSKYFLPGSLNHSSLVFNTKVLISRKSLPDTVFKCENLDAKHSL